MNEGLQDRLEKYGISLYMIRVTLAASLSWMAVNSLYGDRYLYFAPLAAVLITQGTVKASLEKGVYRLLGIILGGIVSLIIGRFFDVGGLSILLMLLLGIGVATACRINIQAVTQIGVTSILALTFYNDGYVIWRMAETFIGVAIAVIINIIIVPPNAFVKAKRKIYESTLLLSDALSGLATGGRGYKQASAALEQAGQWLKRGGQEQKELHFTISHYKYRHELQQLMASTAHLKVIHSYIKSIAEEIQLLPSHYPAADWMIEVMETTADCIAIYGTMALSEDELRHSLTDQLNSARELQMNSFSGLQGQCSLTAIRDLGAVFSHLNRILEEVEQANNHNYYVASVPAGADPAQAAKLIKKKRLRRSYRDGIPFS
ncbi:aromatic acid exporter family protein [Paenibacillus sp. sgz500958]|uniref:FUSC family protein n=1 Tax=Paenibacillus sp. sgz500958 TaxID=3242475 RepID=UPI0036D3AA2F